jgi:ectoine hydroxylase-related dioxygenase (phytanoyl-CoA dioxygenase family)
MSDKNKIKQNEFTFEYLSFFDHKTALETYNNFGVIVLKGLLENSLINELMIVAIHFYKEIQQKIGGNTFDTSTGLERLDQLVISLESNDRKAALQAQKLISQSKAVLNISNSLIVDIASKLLKANSSSLVFESFGSFVPNIPSNTSRLYTYHSEAHWLPYRKNFINVWAPMFREKSINKGTMFIKPLSHKENHDFYEYQGYDGNDNNSFYTQYEVPENNIYSEIPITAEPGDVVFFNRNLLHRSEFNESKKVGYLFVNRYFDTNKDLTISANMNIRPYSKEAIEIGRRLKR